MKHTRLWEIGGFISGAVLILFGAVALYLGINGYQTVGNELSNEAIVGGSDMSPAEIQKAASEAGLPETTELPTCDVVDKSIDTGSEARCFAQYMRIHALEASGGLTYAQMGRFQSAANPDDPAGTSDDMMGPDGYRPSLMFQAGMPELRNDPRFPRLCARLGLVEFWLATGKWPDCVDDVPYDFKAECEKVRDIAIQEFGF